MPPTTHLWAWRLFRAPDDDERFLMAFLHAPAEGSSQEDWSCDEVARTEDEARAYALPLGVSPGNFMMALTRLRATPPEAQGRDDVHIRKRFALSEHVLNEERFP